MLSAKAPSTSLSVRAGRGDCGGVSPTLNICQAVSELCERKGFVPVAEPMLVSSKVDLPLYYYFL